MAITRFILGMVALTMLGCGGEALREPAIVSWYEDQALPEPLVFAAPPDHSRQVQLDLCLVQAPASALRAGGVTLGTPMLLEADAVDRLYRAIEACDDAQILCLPRLTAYSGQLTHAQIGQQRAFVSDHDIDPASGRAHPHIAIVTTGDVAVSRISAGDDGRCTIHELHVTSLVAAMTSCSARLATLGDGTATWQEPELRWTRAVVQPGEILAPGQALVIPLSRRIEKRLANARLVAVGDVAERTEERDQSRISGHTTEVAVIRVTVVASPTPDRILWRDPLDPEVMAVRTRLARRITVPALGGTLAEVAKRLADASGVAIALDPALDPDGQTAIQIAADDEEAFVVLKRLADAGGVFATIEGSGVTLGHTTLDELIRDFPVNTPLGMAPAKPDVVVER